jgi:hypothetical protein
MMAPPELHRLNPWAGAVVVKLMPIRSGRPICYFDARFPLLELTLAGCTLRRTKAGRLTQQQIVEWSLPTRPTKQSDSRAAHWRGESVELDAIPPNLLRQLVRNAIEQHISPERLAVVETAEASERTVAANFLRQQRFNGGDGP